MEPTMRKEALGRSVIPTSCFPPWETSDQLQLHTLMRTAEGEGEKRYTRKPHQLNVKWQYTTANKLQAVNYYAHTSGLGASYILQSEENKLK